VGGVGVAELGDVGTVLFARGGGDWVDTIVAMHINDARCDPATVSVKSGRTSGPQTLSNRHDPSVPNQHIAVIDALPCPIENGRTDNQRIGTRQRLIGAGVRINSKRQRNAPLTGRTRGLSAVVAARMDDRTGTGNCNPPQRHRHNHGAPHTSAPHPELPATKRSFPSTTVRSTFAVPSCCGSIRNRSLSNTTRSAIYPGTRRPSRSS